MLLHVTSDTDPKNTETNHWGECVMHKSVQRICVVLRLGLCSMLGCTSALGESFTFDQQGTRIWLGPNAFAGPMQDWSVQDGMIVGDAGAGRFVSLMSCQLGVGKSFEARATLTPVGSAAKPQGIAAGFRLGTRNKPNDWRRVAMFPQGEERVVDVVPIPRQNPY